jgi:hypothetical protein
MGNANSKNSKLPSPPSGEKPNSCSMKSMPVSLTLVLFRPVRRSPAPGNQICFIKVQIVPAEYP